MDFVAEATVDSLHAHSDRRFVPARICPPMVRRFSRVGQAGRGYTLDRATNRFWDYPNRLRKLDQTRGLFHVIDHSYGQLVHALPAARTVVTCHDVDTFRCLIDSVKEPRSRLFRLMTRRTLSGLQKAARVCCDSETTRQLLVEAGLVAADRVRTVLLPVHPEFSPDPGPDADLAAGTLLGSSRSVDLLHVGSTVARKRIDVLLEIVAQLKSRVPLIRLVRVGGAFTGEQEVLIDRLNIRAHIVCLPPLERRILAAVYRRAALVVLTSEREGFGLPLVEAIASGTPVSATDLPIMREVGADAASYHPLADVNGWVQQIATLLDERQVSPGTWETRRQTGIARARSFSYPTYASQLASVYAELS